MLGILGEIAGIYLGGAAALFVYLAISGRRRNTRLAAWAQSLGLQFSRGLGTEGPIDASFFPARAQVAFDRGVLWGHWNGLAVKYGHYRLPVGLPTVVIMNYSAVSADLSITVPRLEISRKGLAARGAHTLWAPRPDSDSERFSNEIQVKSEDDQFARKLLDVGMMAWLLSGSPKYGFEMAGSKLVVWYGDWRSLKPSKLPQLFDTAVEFAAHIPGVVFDDYATAKLPGAADPSATSAI